MWAQEALLPLLGAPRSCPSEHLLMALPQPGLPHSPGVCLGNSPAD